MQAIYLNFRRSASVLAGLALVLGAVGVKADPTATPTNQSDAFPIFENYLTLAGQASSLSGDKAAFQSVTQQPKSGSLGIEDFHYGKDLANNKSLSFDGRAMSGTDDYLGKLSFAKTDVGSFEMGYKTFRTYYDGVGGFFPLSNTWLPMSPEGLHVDRGSFWVEGKLTLPNAPAITLKYTNDTRRGKKDSTIWGDSDFTGLPNNNSPISQVRKFIPSYLKLDERHQALEASMHHTVGKTSVQVTLLEDKVDNLDTRYVTRFPGEVKLFPTPAATVRVPSANMNNQIVQDQVDGTKAKTFMGRINTETVLTDKVKLLAGFSFQDISNDFSGDRPLFTSTPTKVGVIVVPTNNNLNLLGNAKSTIYTGNIALDTKPTPNSSLKVSLRGEDNYTKAHGSLTSVTAAVNTTTGVVTVTQTPQVEYSRVKETSWTPVLDLGYTGFSNVSLYASGSKSMATGDEYYATPYGTPSPAASALAYNNPSQDHAYYNVGANWRQSSYLTVRADLFYKDNSTRSTGYSIDVGNNYQLDTQFTGVKFSVIVKPLATVTSTSRLVYQKGKAQVTGYLATTPEYDSMDAKNYTFSETVDWTPTAQLYVQANANLVFNVISTIYPRAGTTPATATAVAFSTNGVLQNSNNNNFTGSLLTGAVLTKLDDLQLQLTYYRADNGNSQLAVLTMPYGVVAKEFSVTAGLKHKFSNRLIGNLKVGYYDSQNDTTGGRTNFHGPQAYMSLAYAF